MKKSKKEGIKFENWKSGKTIVQRDSKGRFVSKLPQKGSGIRTKQQAYERIKTSGTLRKDTARVSRRNPSIENGNISKVTIKGSKKSKTIRVKRAKLRKAQMIGKNTIFLSTEKLIPSQQHYQYICTIKWGDNQRESYGYSDLRGTKKQAIQKAINHASSLKIINYTQKQEENVTFIDDKTGQVTDGREIIFFTYEITVKTYVRANESFPTIKA